MEALVRKRKVLRIGEYKLDVVRITAVEHAIPATGQHGIVDVGHHDVAILADRFRELQGHVAGAGCDIEDLLDDSLANVSAQVVQLRRVIPGEAGAIVAVVDVARLSSGSVDAFEDDSCVR